MPLEKNRDLTLRHRCRFAVFRFIFGFFPESLWEKMDFEEALRRERIAETLRLRNEIDRVESEIYGEVEEERRRVADVRWRRDGGLAHDPHASEWKSHKKHLFIRVRGHEIEVRHENKSEEKDTETNRSEFFETEFEDIEYHGAFDVEAALRSLPCDSEDDRFLEIRGKGVSSLKHSSNSNNENEDILIRHGNVEEIFAIDHSNAEREQESLLSSSSRIIKCNGKRDTVIGANMKILLQGSQQQKQKLKSLRTVHDEKDHCVREEALEHATLAVWNSLIPQLERELKRLHMASSTLMSS